MSAVLEIEDLSKTFHLGDQAIRALAGVSLCVDAGQLAVIMGASETILEETKFDEKGNILNPDFHSYQIMTIRDAPEIFSGLVDSYEPRGPFGAKEIGEGSTLPVLGAVAHAIANATGVWITDLPITPEKILTAMRQKKE